MVTQVEIGKRIMEARKRSGLSQSELGRELSVSPQAVGKWERGESMPDIIMFTRIGGVLGVDLNYFGGDMSGSRVPAVRPEAEDASAGDSADGHEAENEAEDARSDGRGEAGAAEGAYAEDRVSGTVPARLLAKGNWTDADFDGVRLTGDRLSSSNIVRCKFTGCDLAGIEFKANNIKNCDFTGSAMDDCTVISSNMEKISFSGCALTAAHFTSNNLSRCDFSGADLTEAVFDSCALGFPRLDEAVLFRTRFYKTGFYAVTFTGVLTDCSFEECGFQKTVFQGVTFKNCFFRGKPKEMRKMRLVACKADAVSYAFLASLGVDMAGVERWEGEER